MAVSVFGNPITNTSLGKDVQKIDRAGAALKLKNSDGKLDSSLKHLEKLKEKLGCIIGGVATFCRVYNATGDTVKFITHHDWVGQNQLSPYPKEIANGQWGVFLHVRDIQPVFPSGSVGAVVYRGKNADGVENDWMLAWNNPLPNSSHRLPNSSQNTAYTEIDEAGHFDEQVWDNILKNLKESGNTSESEWDGCLSSVKIGNEIIPIFDAVLSLKNVN